MLNDAELQTLIDRLNEIVKQLEHLKLLHKKTPKQSAVITQIIGVAVSAISDVQSHII